MVPKLRVPELYDLVRRHGADPVADRSAVAAALVESSGDPPSPSTCCSRPLRSFSRIAAWHHAGLPLALTPTARRAKLALAINGARRCGYS